MIIEEKKAIKTPHNLIMEERKRMTITGITDIDSFDEQTILLFTETGDLTIKGLNLHMNKIDVDTGEVSLEGEIYSIAYSDNRQQKGSLFSRLFK